MLFPVSWAEALQIIQREFPDAVIAGGAIRDTIMRRPVKDLDVFASNCLTYDMPWSSQEVKEWAQKHLGPAKITISEHYAKHCPAVDGILCAVEIDCVLTRPHPIQLILCPSPVSIYTVVERIDFGLCRVAWDGKMLHRSFEFEQDRAREHFTLLRADNEAQYWRSHERWERFQEKYPCWPFEADWDALVPVWAAQPAFPMGALFSGY